MVTGQWLPVTGGGYLWLPVTGVMVMVTGGGFLQGQTGKVRRGRLRHKPLHLKQHAVTSTLGTPTHTHMYIRVHIVYTCVRT